MLPNDDLEKLIAEKRQEIEKEKISLGLTAAPAECEIQDLESKQDTDATNNVFQKARKVKKTVRVEEKVPGYHETQRDKKSSREEEKLDVLPAELERYIRRYLGLPVMLKAGEFSPNNPLIRAERAEPGDVLLGLGEYERRRNTLRKIQQKQYREYLDQQAKKKQEEKERVERERREREEKERQREDERERTRQKDEEDRRASVCYVQTPTTKTSFKFTKTVDTGVQVGIGRPLSVAVQTDEAELLRLSPSPTKSQRTEAERELSPRTVVDLDERPVQPAPWAKSNWSGDASYTADRDGKSARRRSYGDFYERPPAALTRPQSPRPAYKPSILDADAVDRRNLQAVKEAAERRHCYQQELKNQIKEQQRIREERKTREKMLEAAEMRRLEEQLRMLRDAQDKERGRGRDCAQRMKESALDFEKQRTTLQKEINLEEQNLHRASTQPHRLTTSHSEDNVKLPTFTREKRPPYSTNIPPNSIFNPNYDVDSYLRKNLNPKKESFTSKFDLPPERFNRNVVVEKALIHESPKEKTRLDRNNEKPKYEPSFPRNLDEIQDETPIPVLRHSPVVNTGNSDDNLSEGMRLVDDKWKVPAVQKNILKTLPNEQGKNVSILTQLGSIRRQLQLEQLRLDNMITKRN